jgi:hypothetical protein
VAGVLLDAPGVYRLGPVPDGSYHLMAAALPRSKDPLDSLLPGAALRVGRGNGSPLLARGGCVTGVPEVEMRPPRTTDPPVLLALPAFLPKLLAAPDNL